MKRGGLLGLLVALALLAGCGAGGGMSAEERAIRTNLLRVAAAWENQTTSPFYAYYSEDYDFDGLGKDDHLQSIFADFPSIRNWSLLSYSVSVESSTYAQVKMRYSMQLYADISSLDYPTSIESWANSTGNLYQVWKRDFDGVWRIAAEYLAHAWVLTDTPEITDVSVQDGDEFRAGTVAGVSAVGRAANAFHRVTLWPDSFAADSFDPDGDYGWQSVTYSGDFNVDDAAFGEYAFSFIGQTDRPPNTTMTGRRIDAAYIVVSDRSGQKPMRKYRAPTGARKSVFRLTRIHGSAGQTPLPQPRPK